MKSFGANLSRLNEAREEKKNRQRALLEKSSGKKPEPQKKPKRKPSKNVVSPQAPKPAKPTDVPSSTFEKTFPPVLREDSPQHLRASDGLADLVNLYLHAAEHRSRHIIMCWPVAPDHLGLVHALATMHRQSLGDKIGVRGALYPCKTNVFHHLHHLYWDREPLLGLISEITEVGNADNPRVTRSFRDKDPFLWSVKQLQDDNEVILHPAITDLMPHFYADAGFDDWPQERGRLLGNILARIRRRCAKTSLRDTASKVMGNPGVAADAIFAMDVRMDEGALRRAVDKLCQFERPVDAVLVRMTHKIRQENRDWKRLARNITSLFDHYSQNPPGIIYVVDDPRAAYQLRGKLHDYTTQNTTPPFALHGSPSRIGNDSLVTTQEPIKLTQPRTFRLDLVDESTDQLCRNINRLAKINNLTEDPNNPLAAMISFLSRISALPCGLADLVAMMRDNGHSEHSQRRFQFLPLRIQVREYLTSQPLQKKQDELEGHLKSIEEKVGQFQDATPFALRLAEIASHTARSGHDETLLIFESQFRRRLAQRFLERYDDYPDGIQYADFSDSVHFTMIADLESQLHSLTKRHHLVFVGLNTEALKIALCDNRVPNHTDVLLTKRAAFFLRGTLDTIIQHFEENFRPLKPRMESLIQQIPLGKEQVDLMPQSSFQLPDLKMELSGELERRSEDVDPNAWLIHLEGNRQVQKSPSSRLFIYDPLSERSTDRGFRQIELSHLQVGDQLFVLSLELRMQLETLLEAHDIRLYDNDQLSELLQNYRSHVESLMATRYGGMNLTQQVAHLREDILEQHPHLADTFPQVQAMRVWVTKKTAEQLRPQAPGEEVFFKAFAKTLGMDSNLAALFWQAAIQPVRFQRRHEGRHLSEVYTTMLLAPETLMTQGDIKRSEIEALFSSAREHAYAVEFIRLPENGHV